MRSNVIKYGFIGGVIVSIVMSINMFNVDLEAIESGMAEYLGFAGIILSLTAIFFGIRKIRDVDNNGSISFGKAFLAGLYMALIASTLYVITWMFISELFMPEFADQYFNLEVEKIRESGLSEAEIEKQVKSMKDYMSMYENPTGKFFLTYIEIFPIGLLIALISAAILKKK